MKNLIPFLFLIIIGCNQSPKQEQVLENYSNLLGLPRSSDSIQLFLTEPGNEFETKEILFRKFYVFEGLELNFGKNDTLVGIWFNFPDSTKLELPFGIKYSDTRQEIEKKLGEADRYKEIRDNYRALYYSKNLEVRYKTDDLISPIISVGQAKMDTSKIWWK